MEVLHGKMQNCKRIISFYGYCFYTHIQLIHQEPMSIFGDENLALNTTKPTSHLHSYLRSMIMLNPLHIIIIVILYFSTSGLY